MKHLVIGLGEVGSALQAALKADGYDTKDTDPTAHGPYDVIHVCFPWSEKFNASVKRYQKMFEPKYTVIHSTVPIGTSKKLGALHSPIRGRHPDLLHAIRTFAKYLGGPDAHAVADDLKEYGLNVTVVDNSDDTEAGKLFDLMQFGAMILLNKEIKAYCDKHKLKFPIVYTDFNMTYNEGYQAMSLPAFIRPILDHMDGKIGGHCVVQMMELLDSPTAKKIIKDNKAL